MDKPILINADPNAIYLELLTKFNTQTGRTIVATQTEAYIFSAVAYVISLGLAKSNETALQNLVDFATAPMLDYLGSIVGITRLTATPAQTTVQFTLISGHSGVVIPAGLRLSSNDGQITFALKNSVTVDPLITTAEGLFECLTVGTSGNNLGINTIALIIDPQPFLVSATNITVSNGGADTETDERFRESIKEAPSQYSTAGSIESYIYHTKRVSSLIIDASVTNPVGGLVVVYPLIQGAITTPTEILNAVQSALSAEKVRPICDTVQVLSPTFIFYTIEVDIELYVDAIQPQIETAINANLETFKNERQSRLGQDIVISQIIAICSVEGVYKVTVINPSTNIIVNDTQCAVCTSITVNIVGVNVG